MSMKTRVVAIALLNEVRLFTDDATGWTNLDIEAPELEGLLPYADSLQIQWLLDQVGAEQIEWNIEAYVGWDRNHELSAPVAFFATDQSTAGPGLATLVNFSSAHYFRHVRLRLRWRLNGATSAKSAVLSANLYVTTKGA